MMRWLTLLLVVSYGLVGCDRASDVEPAGEVLRVAAPPGRLDPAIAQQFARVTDVQVIVTDSAGAADVRMATGGDVPALIEAQAIRPIDLSQVPNAANLAQRFRSPAYDAGNAHSLPVGWETVGLLYRRDLAADFEATWAVIFDADHRSAPFALYDGDRIMTGIALKYLGHSASAADPESLAAAAALLEQVKADPNHREDPADAAIMVIGSAAAHRAMTDDPRLRFVIPREGSILRVGVVVIPQDAIRPDLAHQFIDYLLDPQIGAQLANFTRAATTNEAAMPYISPEDRADPGIYPPAETMEKLELLAN